MHPLAVLGLAFKRLWRRPVRSFLLLQGTVWGVAVAVFPSAVIAGTREAARTRGAELGADRISIVADPTAQASAPLGRGDLEAVRGTLRERGLVPRAIGGARIAALAGDAGERGALLEADPQTPRARGLLLERGRWLRDGDDETACVVEARAARWLGRERLEPGDEIVVPTGEGAQERLHVVGVTRPQSDLMRRTSDLGFDVTHPLYARVSLPLLLAFGVPFVEDAWKRSDGLVYVLPRTEDLDWIFLRVDPSRVKAASAAASAALVERGRSPVVLHALVLPLVLGEEIDRFGAVQAALFLACLAMGAVVMANLGLLAVLRRGPEIAIRRVEGATRRDIALQFLMEGLVLTSTGCVAGCGLGMALAALRVSLEATAGFTWVFPWTQAAVAVAVALLIGTLAAGLPAARASRTDPVAALEDD